MISKSVAEVRRILSLFGVTYFYVHRQPDGSLRMGSTSDPSDSKILTMMNVLADHGIESERRAGNTWATVSPTSVAAHLRKTETPNSAVVLLAHVRAVLHDRVRAMISPDGANYFRVTPVAPNEIAQIGIRVALQEAHITSECVADSRGQHLYSVRVPVSASQCIRPTTDFEQEQADDDLLALRKQQIEAAFRPGTCKIQRFGDRDILVTPKNLSRKSQEEILHTLQAAGFAAEEVTEGDPEQMFSVLCPEFPTPPDAHTWTEPWAKTALEIDKCAQRSPLRTKKTQIELRPGERIIAVVPEHASGPGWANTPLWVYIEYGQKGLRTECIQPEDQNSEQQSLFKLGAQMHKQLVDSVVVKKFK